MTRICIGLLFLFAISLALLAPSASKPVMAQHIIQKVILKGEPLLPLAGPSEQFSPADVNDSGLVAFYGMDAGYTCGVFTDTPGGGPPTAVVIDTFPAFEGPLYMCNSLGEAPLTNSSGRVAFAANIGSLGGPRAIYVDTPPGSATKVVMQSETAPDGGPYGVPTLLDFNNNGSVLFHAPVGAPSPYPEALFLGQPGSSATKVVAVNDPIPPEAGGGSVSALGDASMNNSGDIAFKATVSGGTKGGHGIFVVSGSDTTWVVGEDDEWKLGEAYSGGEAHHAHSRFVDTFTSVSEPRINDNDQVGYYAITAGGEEGFFIATPGSEYEQAKQGTQDDPSVLGVEGFNGFGGPGRHNLDDNGDIIVPGSGGDPVDGLLVFPSFDKVAIDDEVIPGGAPGDTYTGFVQPALSESGGKVAFKASTSDTSCPSSPCEGVFGGDLDLDDDDGDGILDKWEQSGGWDYNNDGTVDLNLYNMGARDDHKDIFVEVDWMDCTVGTSDCAVGDTHDHQPTAGIIEDGTLGQTCDDGIDNGGDTVSDTADPDCAVVAAFDNAPVSNPDATSGIHLHVLVDEALVHSRFMNFAGSLLEDPDSATPGPCNDGKDNANDGQADGLDSDCTGAMVNEDPDSATPGPCNDNTDNGGDNLCDIAGCPGPLAADPDCVPTDFDSAKRFGTAAERGDPNSSKILAAKTRVFHYAIFAHSLFPDHTATPLWEDTISGYAELPGNDLIIALGEWTATAGEQEGTFMHELGHNLGLDHGGDDSMNYKPNYLSVMNYTFQMPNIVPNRPLDYSRWVLPLQDNEDGAGANTCNDGVDNGPDGVADLGLDTNADTVIDVYPDPDCVGALIESAPVEDPGGSSGPCDDDIDNGGDTKTDELDDDCQTGLDEGRGVDSNMPPAGLASWTTAYTYLRIDPNTLLASCPFATVAAVGDIDWDVNGSYTGISLDTPSVPSANTGGGISDPDPGPSPPDNALCLNATSTLDGYDDWANLTYARAISLSPDASVNDHFTPPPEMATKRLSDGDSDGIADIGDNCPSFANPGQEDGDGDQVGNACDNCPSVWNPDQADSDDNGIGDVCDFPVGGIADLPEVGSDSGLSTDGYPLLAALAAAMLLALAGGAWYARRRWLS